MWEGNILPRFVFWNCDESGVDAVIVPASDSRKLFSHLQFPGERMKDAKKGAHWVDTFVFLPAEFSKETSQKAFTAFLFELI